MDPEEEYFRLRQQLERTRPRTRPIRRFKFGESVITVRGPKRKLTVIGFDRDYNHYNCIPRRDYSNRRNYNTNEEQSYSSESLIAEHIH